ncbi:MAG: U32 family peptidase [Lachnospiraceae bacterium]|nr:U32 family peptidase [Lachnospiraceae bacterium]
MMKKVELLAPAGDFECFKAALAAGADAVYLGLDRFGARAYAGNLSQEELRDALDTAHILGRKIYLTVNTLLKDDETYELFALLRGPYMNGLDGVIVQDIGAMELIRQMFPLLPVHVSTQAAVTGTQGALFLKRLGVSRIVPARELSLDEIKNMKEQTGLELECFIHGSMCYCYSGKCLMSSFIGGRSGNRGRCAQPCRLPYDLAYPMSLKDMCMLSDLPKLIDAGIDSFKIEGRMKSSDYVYTVTSVYRKYIDLYLLHGRCDIEEDDLKKLVGQYTRDGGCDGYYFRHNGTGMISASPSYVSGGADEKNIRSGSLPACPVCIECTIKADEPACINVYNDGFSVSVQTDVIPERSLNRPLSEADVVKQLSKTGGTLFEPDDIKADVGPDLFLTNGQLNHIRRSGIDSFRDEILRSHRRKEPSWEEHTAQSPVSFTCNDDARPPKVVASVLTVDQLQAAVGCNVDSVAVPLALMEHIHPDINCSLYVSLPYVIRDDGYANSEGAVCESVEKLLRTYDIEGFYVSNYESVKLLEKYRDDHKIIGDIHMYAYNRAAYDLLHRSGIVTTVPAELNEHELAVRGITGEELIIYGRLPMMVSASCVYNTERGCQRSPKGHSLYMTDRKNEKLFVRCICSECTNVIYNSVPISIADEKKLIGKIKPSSVRFCFTDEGMRDTGEILRRYISNRDETGFAPVTFSVKYTRGHLKRGVD